MKQKQGGPRRGGSRGPGNEEVERASSPKEIGQGASDCPAFWEERAGRRFPRGFFLDPICCGALPFAVMSECEFEIITLHPTLKRAREVKAELDLRGCARGLWDSCKGPRFHKVIDLREEDER
jgi:hypothetical protein